MSSKEKKKEELNVCDLCEEKKEVKSYIRFDLCSNCYKKHLESSRKNSLIILAITLLPILLMGLVTLVTNEYKYVFYAWFIVGIGFMIFKIPNFLKTDKVDKMYYENAIFLNLFGSKRDTDSNGLAYFISKAIMIIIKFLLSLVLVVGFILLNIINFTNTTLIIKKVDKNVRYAIIAILSLISIIFFGYIAIMIISEL